MPTDPKGKAGKKPPNRLDLGSFAGLLVATGGIVGGLLLEGGRLKDIAQFTAALIVLGGTTGAVLVSTPLRTVLGAQRRLIGIFRDPAIPLNALIDELIGYATHARKNGIVSLEDLALAIEDPFLSKALTLAVDGTDLQEIRKMLELDMEMEREMVDREARVFESAGGYAPTIGIIGAVLGLIQVMKNLANIDEVGHGIAVAFVATVYGVGSANVLFLPVASKIRLRMQIEMQRKDLIVEAVSGIVEGLNPKLIRMRLEAYLQDEPKPKQKPKPAAETKPVASEAPASATAPEKVEA
ncbi:MAG TPA: flagellar motor protein [Bryobacteraceae bacterium]|nr:flagellar motor protein [Bryobacteraceae bacterium]